MRGGAGAAAARADADAAAALLEAIRAAAASFASSAGGARRVDRAACQDAAAALRAVRAMARAEGDPLDAFGDGTFAKATLACVRETLAFLKRERRSRSSGGGGVPFVGGAFLALAVRAASASGWSSAPAAWSAEETADGHSPRVVDALFAARSELFARVTAAASGDANDEEVEQLEEVFFEASAAAADALADEMDRAARLCAAIVGRSAERPGEVSAATPGAPRLDPCLAESDREAAYAAAAALLETLGGERSTGTRGSVTAPAPVRSAAVAGACARGVSAFLRLAGASRVRASRRARRARGGVAAARSPRWRASRRRARATRRARRRRRTARRMRSPRSPRSRTGEATRRRRPSRTTRATRSFPQTSGIHSSRTATNKKVLRLCSTTFRWRRRWWTPAPWRRFATPPPTTPPVPRAPRAPQTVWRASFFSRRTRGTRATGGAAATLVARAGRSGGGGGA